MCPLYMVTVFSGVLPVHEAMSRLRGIMGVGRPRSVMLRPLHLRRHQMDQVLPLFFIPVPLLLLFLGRSKLLLLLVLLVLPNEDTKPHKGQEEDDPAAGGEKSDKGMSVVIFIVLVE